MDRTRKLTVPPNINPLIVFAIHNAHFPLIGSTSLAAASPRGSATCGARGTDAEEGLSFMDTFGGGMGAYGKPVAGGAFIGTPRSSLRH